MAAVFICEAQHLYGKCSFPGHPGDDARDIEVVSWRVRPPVTVSVRRAALRLGTADLIDDLVVPLRRRFPAG